LVLLLLTIAGDVLLAAAGHGATSVIGNELVVLFAAGIGGLVAARVGRVEPLRHASILAVIILLVGLSVGLTQHGAGAAPQWYAVSVSVLGALGAFVGGALSMHGRTSGR
jgi:hypothetical protein